MAINSIESAAQGHGITQGLPASKMSATRPGKAIRFRDIGKLAVACRTCATRSSCRGSRGLLFKLLGEELNRVRHMMLIIAKKDAELRVASFLCNLSLRLQARGLSARAFNLSMSRQDIGNHLGLTIETVSRVLRHLQQDGLLEVNRRRISIHDHSALNEMAGNTLQGRINRE